MAQKRPTLSVVSSRLPLSPQGRAFPSAVLLGALGLSSLALVACGADDPSSEPLQTAGAAGTDSAAGAAGAGGVAPGVDSAGPGNGSLAGGPTAGTAGTTAAAGTENAAGAAMGVAGSAQGGAGNPGAGAGTDAGSAGAAGTDAGSAGQGGSAGSAGQGGAPGDLAGAGGTDAGGAAPMAGGPSDTPEACPADATFCSGFESPDMPDDAVYNRNAAPAEWDADFVVDTDVKYSGNSSLRVKTLTEEAQSAYKMLAVPAPGSVFWVRAFMRGSSELGAGPNVSDGQHNRLMVATNGSDTNTTDALEIADDCGFALNSHDSVYRAEGDGGTCDSPLRLAANEWHCVEVSFNGQTGDTQVYVDGALKIDAVGWEPGKGNFTHLKFGVDHLHAIDRSVWYDDIAVGPTRPGCY